MANKIDTKKLLEQRFVTINEQLDSLKPGSEDYDRLLKNLCSVQSELTNMKKVADQATDNASRRREQKRMNDEELKFKDEQLKIETYRASNEKEFRKRQNSQNLIIEAGKLIFAGIGLSAYEHRWKRAMDCEYAASDQSSVFPTTPINRLLTEQKPKIYNF